MGVASDSNQSFNLDESLVGGEARDTSMNLSINNSTLNYNNNNNNDEEEDDDDDLDMDMLDISGEEVPPGLDLTPIKVSARNHQHREFSCVRCVSQANTRRASSSKRAASSAPPGTAAFDVSRVAPASAVDRELQRSLEQNEVINSLIDMCVDSLFSYLLFVDS